MHDLPTIARLLHDVRRACESDSRTLAREAGLVAELGKIDRAAQEMLADFVLRFAAVGDSNAGTSRLIGCLIGSPDALPVKGKPYTGNIVIMRIRSDPATATTALGPYHLRFITADEARECLAHLVESFLARLADLNGTDELVRAGRELLRQPGGLLGDALHEWLGTAWGMAAARSVNVRMRLAELVRFVVAWRRLGPGVCGREKVPVLREAAVAAMMLPPDVEAGDFGEFVRAVETSIAAATGSSGQLAAFPAEVTPAFAAACYPLIRDIRMEARVPAAVWDLSGLRVEAIELFDFPGLDAQTSAARDTFLSLRERRRNRIHTWVIAVNSCELKGSQATEIVKDLPHDRVVAVANRFDGLPLWIDGEIKELDRLVAPGAPPVRQAETLHRLELLAPLARIFSLLLPARPERCVLVSAMQGLMDLDEVPALRHRLLTDEQRTDWRAVDELARGRAVQPKWGQLAGKIHAAEPDSPLAGWLAEYARPNGQSGLGRLRDILVEHATRIGWGQLTEEMNERLAELGVAIRAFLLRASQPVEESLARANEIRLHIDKLLGAYSEAEPPRGIADVQVKPLGAQTGGRLPITVAVLSPLATGPAPLAELVRDEVLLRVWEWGAWEALLQAARDDGFIDTSSRPRADDPDDPAPWEVEVQAPPMRAGEFHQPFRTAYAEVEAIAFAALRSSLLDFLTAMAAKLAPLDGPFAPLARNLPNNAINFALRPNGEQTAGRLLRRVECVAPIDRPTDAFWRDRFPFLVPTDADGNLTAGPFFGWAPERRTAAPNKTQHQMGVFRLRAELAAAIETGVNRELAAALIAFRQRFDELRTALVSAANKLKRESPANLLALFGRPAAVPRETAGLALRAVADRLSS